MAVYLVVLVQNYLYRGVLTIRILMPATRSIALTVAISRSFFILLKTNQNPADSSLASETVEQDDQG